MKLATALTERANLQNKISELSIRLNNNAKVQEGDIPSEDPNLLLKELSKCIKSLEELISRINHTNSVTFIDDKTISDYIAKKDTLKQKISVIRNFLDTASERATRYSKAEIKIISTVSVVDIQKDLDKLSKELRLIEEKIEEANWTTELI